jgi:hypothetical protein
MISGVFEVGETITGRVRANWFGPNRNQGNTKNYI